MVLEAVHRLLCAGRVGQALAALEEGKRSWGWELDRAEALRALCHFLQWAASSDADLRRMAPDAPAYGRLIGEVWQGRSPLRHALAARFQLSPAAGDASNGFHLALQLAAWARSTAAEPGHAAPVRTPPPTVWRATEAGAEGAVTDSSEGSADGSGEDSGAEAGEPDSRARAPADDAATRAASSHPLPRGPSFNPRALPLNSAARKVVSSCLMAMAREPGALTPVLLLLTVAACSRSAVPRTHAEARQTLHTAACEEGVAAPAALDLFLALTLWDCADRRAAAAGRRSSLLVAATALAARAPHSPDAACTVLAAGLLELDGAHPCLPDAMRCACALQRAGPSAAVSTACGGALWALALALARGASAQEARSAALAVLPPARRRGVMAREEELRSSGRRAPTAPQPRRAAVRADRKRRRPRLEWEGSDSEEGDDDLDVEEERQGAVVKTEEAATAVDEATAPLLFSTGEAGPGEQLAATALDAVADRLHVEEAPPAERLRGWLAALALELAPFLRAPLPPAAS